MDESRNPFLQSNIIESANNCRPRFNPDKRGRRNFTGPGFPGRKKRGHGNRSWIKIELNGNSKTVELDKSTVMRHCSLPARDLRLLDPLFIYPSTILGREKAIVVSLEQIRCIITADEVFLMNSLDGSVVQYKSELCKRLQQEIYHSDDLPFEFRALELALEFTCLTLDTQEGSQETVATMIGMALGMFLAHITMGHSMIIWFSFLSLTMFHMYANYKAVRCLHLSTLNCERSSILLQHFMETGLVLSSKEVSILEHVLPLWISSWSSKNTNFLYTRVRLGVRVSSLNNLEMKELLRSAGSRYEKAKYLLLEKNGIISIVMHKDSSTGDVMKGFVHALLMANLLHNHKPESLHIDSQTWMDKNYETFLLKLQSCGWKTERLLSSSIIWRANWTRGAPYKKIN